MSLDRIPLPSPNYSSRGGSGVRLIVLHTAEGATTIESLGNFFANPASQVSSHAGADDKPNTVGIYVKRGDKAWTSANANPVAVQIELCAFAEWSSADWNQHPTMLANCAAWIAEEAAAFGIPIRGLSDGEAQGGAAGVCQHVNLGSWGGGHWDCGGPFPFSYVLEMAGASTPVPGPSPQEDDDLPLHLVLAKGQPEWWLTDWMTKRYIGSPDQAAQVIVSTIATGGKIETDGNNGPVPYDAATVNAVPRCDA
jgi:hypothetical protein